MSQEIKIIVGIPTINRSDLLNEALKYYFEDFKNTPIVICDNGNQDILFREENFVLYRPNKNLGVSGSWNMIMDYAKRVGATHVLMLNDDVVLGLSEKFINLILCSEGKDLDFISSNNNWSAFILKVESYEKIGKFDENFFPAYFEDNDYAYRMTLSKAKVLYLESLNPKIYRNSMTIQKDPSLNQRFQLNREYYISKWGGIPSEEKYSKPFNQ